MTMGVLHAIKTVAWSFIGIRRNSDYQDDLRKLNPLHVVAGALAGVAVFVGGLVLLVHWVTK